MSNNITTTILDAGGRYGIHPTWKPFTGELQYHLFEPDPSESDRLKIKYKLRSEEIKIIAKAVTEKNGSLVINFFRNRAMSSSTIRLPTSSLFEKGGEREHEVEVIESIEVDAVSIDSYCSSNGIAIDFIKLDTEGNEYQILQGAKKQLTDNILGVRCEVNFDYTFERMPLFNALHEFMLDQRFFLLNLDYNGRGDLQNEFVQSNGRYGILSVTDAVWMRRPSYLFESKDSNNKSIALKTMKYAAFCLMNNGSDVAIKILLEARQKYNINFTEFSNTKLFKFLDISIHKLFYSLKWQPAQSLVKHQETFFAIFDKHMKVMNEFMESEDLNPD